MFLFWLFITNHPYIWNLNNLNYISENLLSNIINDISDHGVRDLMAANVRF